MQSSGAYVMRALITWMRKMHGVSLDLNEDRFTQHSVITASPSWLGEFTQACGSVAGCCVRRAVSGGLMQQRAVKSRAMSNRRSGEKESDCLQNTPFYMEPRIAPSCTEGGGGGGG